eukprot:CAMPEP_0201506386 /NCGR_PEP_ID=MMETSP0161_2-20130828/297_1 /ASSEMBLY_ACC=CAM_ASM_000251 /TAXON_ID=180227 /ORGANISM="Neoparamoeba aestuarina, Strain SoJaBio B1-5/56/2" /LENGTH=251 /DNA_ID=CAMNT_0047900455 /DNA_START=267 /DNA_END=1019 /DNA_ORIENTATION=-
MMLVNKQWKEIAREDSFWKNLCFRTFPDSVGQIETIRREVGDYYNAFKVWHKFHFCSSNGRTGGKKMFAEKFFAQQLPPKPPQRFSLENLLTYIEVQHQGRTIWKDLQQGTSLLNSRLEMNNVPPISCSFGMTPKDIEIRLSFLLIDHDRAPLNAPHVWVSDTYLRPEKAMVSFKVDPNLVIIAQSEENSETADRFLGELRFLITPMEGSEQDFELSLNTFYTSFLKPTPTPQIELPERHMLALLRRNLHW